MFKALILGSVFSTSLSYSALSIDEKDFESVGLQIEFAKTPKSVQKKLKSGDLDRGLFAARKIDELTSDKDATTSKTYLEQILKALAAQDSGDVEGQDGEMLTGFGNQIDRLLGFLQSAAKAQQMLDKPGTPLSHEQVLQLQSTLQFIGENIESFLRARKEMAKAFWVRRVGHNPKHRDAFEKAWDALLG